MRSNFTFLLYFPGLQCPQTTAHCSASQRPLSDPSPATLSPRSPHPATWGADNDTPDSHVRNRDGQKDDGFAGKQLVKGTRGKEKREQSEEMGRCFNGILLTGWVGMWMPPAGGERKTSYEVTRTWRDVCSVTMCPYLQRSYMQRNRTTCVFSSISLDTAAGSCVTEAKWRGDAWKVKRAADVVCKWMSMSDALHCIISPVPWEVHKTYEYILQYFFFFNLLWRGMCLHISRRVRGWESPIRPLNRLLFFFSQWLVRLRNIIIDCVGSVPITNLEVSSCSP